VDIGGFNIHDLDKFIENDENELKVSIIEAEIKQQRKHVK